MFQLFLRFGCGDPFCTDTFLQTDDVTHRNLYTEQFLRADILTQRGLCTKKLYTDAFTHRGFYAKKDVFTQMFCTKMLLRAKIKHIGIFTHRTFATEKPLHRTVFTHVFSTQKTFDTEKLVHTDCAQKFLQTDFFTRRNFTQSSFYTAIFFSHRNLYAQKIVMCSSFYKHFYRHTVFTQKILRTEILRTEGFTHNIFYIQTLLHTDAFTQTQIAHRNLCTQHAFNTVNFYTERLCFPFLITYLSCSSSQVMIAFCWENDGVTG